MGLLNNKNMNWSDRSLKPTIFKKLSGMLVVVLIVSMLAPMMAFAGVFYSDDIKYQNGKVTGTVYSADTIEGVYLNVYGPDKTLIETVYLDEFTSDDKDGHTYNFYNFEYDLGVKDAVYLGYFFDFNYEGVVYTVYSDDYSKFTHQTTSSGGGGIFIPAPTDSLDSYGGIISESALKSALAADKGVTINLKNSDTIALPANALVEAQEGSELTIVGENGTYVLPIDALDLEALAKELGVELKDLKINVEIKKVAGDAAADVDAAVTAAGGNALSDAVDFNVTAEGKDGKTIAVDFGTTYVQRSLNVKTAASKTATVALYNPETKALSFVPSKVGEKTADFWRTGNSVYVVVENTVSFNDVAADFWAKANIELLASKLVVEGTGAGQFEPERDITRAEFAALAVKALGLNVPSVVNDTYFTDVEASDWSAGFIAAAKAAGLVDGYEDGSFKPNQVITREELSALVVRALKFAGVEVSLNATEQADLLAKFSDASNIVWAQEEVAVAIKAGIVDGMTDTTLATDESATRAQSAAMLKRLLSKAGFIE